MKTRIFTSFVAFMMMLLCLLSIPAFGNQITDVADQAQFTIEAATIVHVNCGEINVVNVKEPIAAADISTLENAATNSQCMEKATSTLITGDFYEAVNADNPDQRSIVAVNYPTAATVMVGMIKHTETSPAEVTNRQLGNADISGQKTKWRVNLVIQNVYDSANLDSPWAIAEHNGALYIRSNDERPDKQWRANSGIIKSGVNSRVSKFVQSTAFLGNHTTTPVMVYSESTDLWMINLIEVNPVTARRQNHGIVAGRFNEVLIDMWSDEVIGARSVRASPAAQIVAFANMCEIQRTIETALKFQQTAKVV